jgi:hypothetical protein
LVSYCFLNPGGSYALAAPETANVSPIAAAAVTSFLIMNSSLSMINISGCKHEKKHISFVGRRDILVIF